MIIRETILATANLIASDPEVGTQQQRVSESLGCVVVSDSYAPTSLVVSEIVLHKVRVSPTGELIPVS